MENADVGGKCRGTAVAPEPGSGLSGDPSLEALGALARGDSAGFARAVAREPQECKPGPAGTPWASHCRNCGNPVHTDRCPEKDLAALASWVGWAESQSFSVSRADLEATSGPKAAQLGLVVDGAEVAPARLASEDQWHTPRRLADRLLTLVDVRTRLVSRGRDAVRGMADPVVLDLGGGGGALTDAALRVGASSVVVVERDPKWAAFLRTRYAGNPAVRVVEADVDELAALSKRGACARLGLEELPDVVISNPPFSGGGFVRFGLAAIVLSKVGAPCAFIGPIVALPTKRSLSLWKVAEISDLAICSLRPSFGGEVERGAMEDFIAVRFAGELSVGETHHGARVHFWSEAWS